MKYLQIILPGIFFLLSSFIVYAQDTVIYVVDTAASKVEWSCDLHQGYFKLDNGSLLMKKGKLAGGSFDICMESITDVDIDYELMRLTLQNTLKSKDFLYTAKYHYTTFVIDDVRYEHDSAYIVGDLTFLGITECISFSCGITFLNDSIIARTEKIVIDRTDYGNITMSKEDAKSDKSFIVPNEVDIVIDLKGYRSP